LQVLFMAFVCDLHVIFLFCYCLLLQTNSREPWRTQRGGSDALILTFRLRTTYHMHHQTIQFIQCGKLGLPNNQSSAFQRRHWTQSLDWTLISGPNPSWSSGVKWIEIGQNPGNKMVVWMPNQVDEFQRHDEVRTQFSSIVGHQKEKMNEGRIDLQKMRGMAQM
jgi:hypothetical protein